MNQSRHCIVVDWLSSAERLCEVHIELRRIYAIFRPHHHKNGTYLVLHSLLAGTDRPRAVDSLRVPIKHICVVTNGPRVMFKQLANSDSSLSFTLGFNNLADLC